MNGENTSDNIFHKSLPAVMGGRQFFTKSKTQIIYESKNRKFMITPLNPARPSRRKRFAALFFAAWGML